MKHFVPLVIIMCIKYHTSGILDQKYQDLTIKLKAMTRIDNSIWMDSIRSQQEKKNIITTVPFLQVVDIATSIEFYVQKLGFEIFESWEPKGNIEWCHLKKDGGELMLQQFKPYHTVAIEKNMSIYFSCVDALAIYREIGFRKINATEPVVSNGKWITRVIDPDGYEINFKSFAQAPEGTILSKWSD